MRTLSRILLKRFDCGSSSSRSGGALRRTREDYLTRRRRGGEEGGGSSLKGVTAPPAKRSACFRWYMRASRNSRYALKLPLARSARSFRTASAPTRRQRAPVSLLEKPAMSLRPGSPAVVRGTLVTEPTAPLALAGGSLAEYLASLDLFRRDRYHAWSLFPPCLTGSGTRVLGARHVALTAVPRPSADLAAAWVVKHFGSWITTFAFVPARGATIDDAMRALSSHVNGGLHETMVKQ